MFRSHWFLVFGGLVQRDLGDPPENAPVLGTVAQLRGVVASDRRRVHSLHLTYEHKSIVHKFGADISYTFITVADGVDIIGIKFVSHDVKPW